MELSRKDTKMLQGLAVLAMVCLHLFCGSDYEGLFHPFIFIGSRPLSFFFGQLSDFCVMCFAFCSGYAHMALYKQENYYKNRLKSLIPLLINYWLVILFYCIVNLCLSNGLPGGIQGLLGNVFLYNVSYNGAWWYMWAYVLLVLISPLILKTVQKVNSVIILVIGLAIYVVAYYFRFKVDTSNYFLVRFGPFGMTLFEYIIGCVFYKNSIFSKLYKIWEKLPKAIRIIGSIVIFVSLLFIRTLFIPTLFVAPISGLMIMILFHFWRKPKFVETAFLFVGNHSTNIWLTHMFFYHTLFVNLVYNAYEPILIYLFMLTITIALSYILKLIMYPINKWFKNNKKEKTV